MKKLFYISFVLGYIAAQCSYGQGSMAEGDYLGYPMPGEIPEVFAPDFISTEYAEFAGSFSPDFKEFYFTRRGPFPGGIAQIMVCTKNGDDWSAPEVAPFSSNNYEFEPFITPDGGKLYFGSRRSPDGVQSPGVMHQWYLEKDSGQWSEPILLGEPFFSRMVMYPSISLTNTFYFTDMDGIYFSELIEGQYQQPVKLGDEINVLPLTAHSYIAPDESYLIFDGQPRGEGLTDIFISYKRADGSWTNGKNMGKEINSGTSQAIASVSPDGECLFFTRNNDIYWVDAAIIDNIRLIPEMTYSPDSGMAPLNLEFNLNLHTVPDSLTAFEWDFDMDGEVDSHDQNPTFRYTKEGIYSVSLKVFADSISAMKTYQNIIVVEKDTSGYGLIDWPENIHDDQLFQNYPNPFNDDTMISYSIAEESKVKLCVFDYLGNVIETLVDDVHKPGSYYHRFKASELQSGPYLYSLITNDQILTRMMLKQ